MVEPWRELGLFFVELIRGPAHPVASFHAMVAIMESIQNGCSAFEMSSPDQTQARERIAAELATPTGRLDLSNLQISELPPELNGLKSLQSLDCSFTQVSDLEPLRNLSSFSATCLVIKCPPENSCPTPALMD